MKRLCALIAVIAICGLTGTTFADVVVGGTETFTAGGAGAEWGIGAPSGWQSVAAASGNNTHRVVYGSEGAVLTTLGEFPYQWSDTMGQPDPGSHSGDPGTMVMQHMCNWDGGLDYTMAGTQITYITFPSQTGVTYKLAAWVNTTQILNPNDGSWLESAPFPGSDFFGGHPRSVSGMVSQFGTIQIGLKNGDFDPTDLTTDYTAVTGLIDNLTAANPADAWVATPEILLEGTGGNMTIILKLIAPDISAGARSDLDVRWDDIALTVEGGECSTQHLITDITPTSSGDDADVTLTINGSDLEWVTNAKLVPIAGGASINATNITVGAGPNETTMTAEFPTFEAPLGTYHLITEQALPCAAQQLTNVFDVVCSIPTIINAVSPNNIDDPEGLVELTITGENLDQVDTVKLVLGNDWVVLNGAGLTIDGDNLLVTFDMSCVPAGTYFVKATVGSACPAPTVSESLANAVMIRKVPANAETCVWKPWAASWSALNLGDDLDPPNGMYNPTNWDYSMSQSTNLGMLLDTPDGSKYAFHMLYGTQMPDFPDGAAGSGGIFQEIAVTPGVPIEYSFEWKAGVDVAVGWYELMLIDGPFSLWDADAFQEDEVMMNNPSIIRKTELPNGLDMAFDWATVTSQDPADMGNYGPRPTTITPTGNVATVVLKTGRAPRGASEALFDNIQVWQAAGPDLVTNGDFEDNTQLWVCNNTTIYQDECENNFWLEADLMIPPPCNDPYADADYDGDVDQDDFGMLQACITGVDGGPVAGDCACFDRIDPGSTTPDGDVDQVDYIAFEACATGPAISTDITCDDGI